MIENELPGQLLANHSAIEQALGRTISESQLQEIANADAHLSNMGAPMASTLLVALGKMKDMDLTGVKPSQAMRTLEVLSSTINAALAQR